MLARDSFRLTPLHPCAGLLADFSAFEYLFHRCPVRFDPASIMATVPVRRYSDLRKFEFGPTRNFLEVEYGDGKVIRPPAGRPPCLDNLLSGLNDQVKSSDVPVPRRELASGLSTDLSFLAGKRSMFLRVHQHFVDLTRRSLERGGLPKCSGVHPGLLHRKFRWEPSLPGPMNLSGILFIPAASGCLPTRLPIAFALEASEKNRMTGRGERHPRFRSCGPRASFDFGAREKTEAGGRNRDCWWRRRQLRVAQ